MDMPRTRESVLSLSRDKYAEFTQAIDALSDAQMMEPGADGDWRARDILAHVGADEMWMAAQLEALLAGEEPTALSAFGRDVSLPPDMGTSQDERNAWQYISKAGWRRAPEPEEPPVEIPELIVLAFRELHRVRGLRPRDVVAEMGWTENVLRRVVSREQMYDLDNIGGGAIVVSLEDARLDLKPRRNDGGSN